MKKLVSILLGAMMLFACVACTDGGTDGPTGNYVENTADSFEITYTVTKEDDTFVGSGWNYLFIGEKELPDSDEGADYFIILNNPMRAPKDPQAEWESPKKWNGDKKWFNAMENPVTSWDDRSPLYPLVIDGEVKLKWRVENGDTSATVTAFAMNAEGEYELLFTITNLSKFEAGYTGLWYSGSGVNASWISDLTITPYTPAA